MNYRVTDQPYPRGEIWIRGDTVFKGYYKDEKNTQETLNSEGWLATGDIGFVDNRGCFTIVDRKKNIFKVETSLRTVTRFSPLKSGGCTALTTFFPHLFFVILTLIVGPG